MKRKLGMLSCAVALLLLPSCVQCHIGQRIREGGVRHTGVDILHPVDEKLYRTPAMRKDDTAIARAPEVTYCVYSPLLTLAGDKDGNRTAGKVAPTGQVRVVRLRCEEENKPWSIYPANTPRQFIELAEGVPANAEACPVGKAGKLGAYKLESPYTYGSLTEPTKPSAARRLAAAPFDYLIDPVISAAHTAVNVPLFILAAPFAIPWMYCNMHH